jgi:hypothetical protein
MRLTDLLCKLVRRIRRLCRERDHYRQLATELRFDLDVERDWRKRVESGEVQPPRPDEEK